jgi:thiol-disulfide isomerase/thioredoxin
MFEKVNVNWSQLLLFAISILILLYFICKFNDDKKSGVVTQFSGNKSVTNPKYTMYNFYSPGCMYCQKFAPVWNQLQQELSGNQNIQFKKVDATDPSNERITFYYNINKYPTIIFTSSAKNIEYVGDRTIEDMKNFIHKYSNDN